MCNLRSVIYTDRIYSREISKWNVYVGEHNQAKNEDDEVIHKIKKLIRHENYVEWSEYPDTDIGMYTTKNTVISLNLLMWKFC